MCELTGQADGDSCLGHQCQTDVGLLRFTKGSEAGADGWHKIGGAPTTTSIYDFATVFLEPNQRTLRFGGRDFYYAPVDDMWEWDGNAWSSVSAPAPPSPRYDHAMAYGLSTMAFEDGSSLQNWFTTVYVNTPFGWRALLTRN